MRSPREVLGLEGASPSWLEVIVDVLSGTLVMTGVALIVSTYEVGVGIALVAAGILCWTLWLALSIRAARRRPSNPSQ